MLRGAEALVRRHRPIIYAENDRKDFAGSGTDLFPGIVSRNLLCIHETRPMSKPNPGRSHRAGITIAELFRMYPDGRAAERWFIEQRWPDGIACHYCGSMNVQTGCAHKTMPFRCRTCRKRFSVRTGTVMQSSKLRCQVWLIAMYLMTTSLKGVSSMKLHRDLGITQKSAWHLAHRLRETWKRDGNGAFFGPVEADENWVGGKAKSMSNRRRKEFAGRKNANKTVVAGVRDPRWPAARNRHLPAPRRTHPARAHRHTSRTRTAGHLRRARHRPAAGRRPQDDRLTDLFPVCARL